MSRPCRPSSNGSMTALQRRCGDVDLLHNARPRSPRRPISTAERSRVAFVSEPLVFDEYHGMRRSFSLARSPTRTRAAAWSSDQMVSSEQGLEEVRFLMMVPRDLRCLSRGGR